MQALANGDWFVGWGEVPDFSEFSPTGAAALRRALPRRRPVLPRPPLRLDRRARDPPALALAVATARQRRQRGTVYASWNGATLVARLAGARGRRARTSLKPVAQAPRSGFETAIALPAGTRGRYVTVQALGATGQVLGGATTVAAQGP